MARFGLADSESESESGEEQVIAVDSDEALDESDETGSVDEPPVVTLDQSFDGDEGSSEGQDEDEDHSRMHEDDEDSEEEYRRRRPLSPSPFDAPAAAEELKSKPWPKQLGLEPRRVAVMQASLFGNASPPPPVVKQPVAVRRTAPVDMDDEPILRPIRTSAKGKEPAAREPVRPPSPPAPSRIPELPPASSSVTHSHLSSAFADPSLVLGRSSRASFSTHPFWGVLSTSSQPLTEADRTKTPRRHQRHTVKVNKLKFTSALTAEEAESQAALTAELLELQLAHTPIYASSSASEDGVPFAVPHPDLRFKDYVTALSAREKVDSEELSLWRLGQVLFDEVQDTAGHEVDQDMQDAEDEQESDITALKRSYALSLWLQDVARPLVEAELRELASTSNGPSSSTSGTTAAQKVFALLSGCQIERACYTALDGDLARLATLVAQLGNATGARGIDRQMREDVALQLRKWAEYDLLGPPSEAVIGKEMRRVYELIAGNLGSMAAGAPRGGKAEQVLAGLDWKRAFGAHFWYGTPPPGVALDAETTNLQWLRQAMETYEAASAPAASAVARPLPSYLASQVAPAPRNDVKDAAFELLKLYLSPTHPLESVLSPLNFTASPLDYRLPWHLYVLLSRVLRRRDFEDRVEREVGEGVLESLSERAEALTVSWASQLEASGNWKWAVFVLLHLEVPSRRMKAIQEVLARNVGEIDGEAEVFLVESLRIPTHWIYDAKALVAKADGDSYLEYGLLLQAGKSNEAHQVASSLLAPEAIIRGDFDLVRRLLGPFEAAASGYADEGGAVSEWEASGKVYLDFVELVSDTLPQFYERRATHPASQARDLALLADKLSQLLTSVTALLDRPGAAARGGLTLKVAVTEMQSRLTGLNATLRLNSKAIQPSKLQESDRLVWLQGAGQTFLEGAISQALQ